MEQLRVEVNGTITMLEARRSVRVGRSPDADILLTGETVSRRHAELRPTNRGWVLVDVGSQHGTYVEGQRISERPVTAPIRVYCGLSGSGSGLTLVPEGPLPTRREGGGVIDPALAATRTADVRAAAEPPPRSGPDIVIRTGGGERRFRHPSSIAIGRHPDCAVVISDPGVSRHHGRLDGVPGAWRYTNLSGEGSYVDGARTEAFVVTETTTVRLGDPVDGPEVVLAPVGAMAATTRTTADAMSTGHRRPCLVTLWLLGAAIAPTGASTTSGPLTG